MLVISIKTKGRYLHFLWECSPYAIPCYFTRFVLSGLEGKAMWLNRITFFSYLFSDFAAGFESQPLKVWSVSFRARRSSLSLFACTTTAVFFVSGNISLMCFKRKSAASEVNLILLVTIV